MVIAPSLKFLVALMFKNCD